MNKIKVIVECKPDEILAKAIGFKLKEVRHQPNKGEVCNYFRKSESLLAIVDEDPTEHGPNKYLKQFVLQDEKFDVRILYLKSENKTIIVLKPRLEEWILKRCKATHIKPEEYHLSSNSHEFKDKINNTLSHFEKLLAELLDNKDEGIMYLKNSSANIYK